MEIIKFMEQFANHRSLTSGEIEPLILHDKFKKIMKDFESNNFNIVLKKTRQSGLTTMLIWYTVYKMIEWKEEDEKIIFILRKTFSSAKDFVMRVKKILMTLGYNEFDINRQDIQFSNI